MADTEDTPNNITLMPNDLVGVMRQGLGELQAYLGQPMGQIDPSVPIAYLERMHGFAMNLLNMQQAMQQASNDAKAEKAPARKN